MNTTVKTNDYKAKLEQIKLSFSLLDVCQDNGVYMKKVGKNYRGICPFHLENSPSFFVNPQKQIWKCFGCNKSGDVINLYALLHGFSNKQAIKVMSNLLGLNNTGKYSVQIQDLAQKRAERQDNERAFREAYTLLLGKLSELISSFRTMIASFKSVDEIEKNAIIYHEYARLQYLQEQALDVVSTQDENEMYFILKDEFLHYKPLLSFMTERGLV